jgi:hypothetical protein
MISFEKVNTEVHNALNTWQLTENEIASQISTEKEKVELILVSPEMAEKWLLQNTDNRAHRDWWSITLSNAIRNGNWVTTHQGIVFSESGRLINGQHTLNAIIKSGLSVKIFVFTGISDKAFQVIDCGLKRTIADLTGLAQKTSEVCRFLADIIRPSRTTTLSSDVLRVANAGIADLHDELIEYCNHSTKVFSSAPVRAAVILKILEGYPKELLKEHYANLVKLNYQHMPSIMHSFSKQVTNGTITTGEKYKLLGKAMKVFTPENFDNPTLRLSEIESDSTFSYAKKIILNTIQLKESK